jgi:hypothetical protein
MRANPKAFMSYSHSDREVALRLGEDLRSSGVDVWVDRWEIRPGDSLIEKIFSEGLAEADFFLILLSPASVRSKWVTEELDAAVIRKIEGVTRIIPVIVEQCDVPLALRSLLWVDLSADYQAGLRALQMTIHEVWDTPPVGRPPDYVLSLRQSVGGLSPMASTLGSLLLARPQDGTGFEKGFSAGDLQRTLVDWSPSEVNDAVDELENYGLVETVRALGTAPYTFVQASPTYALFLHFKDEGLGYDPEEDIKAVASAVVAADELDGARLRELVPLPPVRLNRAVAYLEDYGYLQVLKYLGTAPYSFGSLRANWRTRQFVQETCR